jgi:type I restriction-modification system DNA methylase subunit
MTNLKKRLGQYFSGSKVANLLVFLCNPEKGASALDPMAGSGDMLVALERVGVKDVHGIEVDPEAAKGHHAIVIGDAFSAESHELMERKTWDLVITNPPYVRHQTAKEISIEGIALKGAKEARNGLIDVIRTLPHLEDKEKKFFEEMARAYSGLSDLAVPSWMLCAALTAPGGLWLWCCQSHG